jgi:predicted P-loop ATPase
MPDIHNKDAALQMRGRWIVELGELAAMRKAQIEGFKAFISRPVDVFRPPYGRRTVTAPRQSIFIATTNETEYLRDSTGNRRFWPVSCGHIRLDDLARDRDQLYAEAVAAFRAGELWYLSQSEAALAASEQEHRRLVTEIEASVSTYLEGLLALSVPVREISTRDVFVHALALSPDTPDFAERTVRLGTQVSDAMVRAGWRKVKRTGRGVNRRTIYAAPAYQESPR